MAMIAFDELTHFSEEQFFYMLSRNRSVCGIKPYIRATTNPDPDSWVADFISWWIDQDTGYSIAERSGKVRWMIRLNDTLYWDDDPVQLLFLQSEGLINIQYYHSKTDFPGVGDSVTVYYANDTEYAYKWDDKSERHYEELIMPKSVTFIASKLTDNKILMDINPGYMSNLKALTMVQRERLLGGNWKIRQAAGLMFKRSQIPENGWLQQAPADVVQWVRGWDLAATDEAENGEAAYTAGVLIGKYRNGRYVVAHVTNVRLSAAEARKHIKSTAIMDKNKYRRTKIRLPQDPGQAGKDQKDSFIKYLAGFSLAIELESGSKVTRAEPFAAQWQAGNVDIVVGEWNEEYLSQLEGFPESKFKDMVDASSSAFNELEKTNITSLPPMNDSLAKESYWKGR